MGTSPRTHTIPLAGETPRRQAIIDGFASVNDIVPVANTTARAQVLADLTAAGQAPTAARPLYVMQTDTREVWEHNGTTWSPWGLRGYVYSTRLDTNATAGNSTMATVLTLSLPADSPAGIYLLDVGIRWYCNVNATAYKRITVGGTELPGTGSDENLVAGHDSNRSIHTTFNHISGGATAVVLSAQINGGAPPWQLVRSDTYIRAAWMGRA